MSNPDAARAASEQEAGIDATMAAGLLLTLKQECEAQHARAEALRQQVQALQAEKAQWKQFPCGHMIWKIKHGSDGSYIESDNEQCPTWNEILHASSGLKRVCLTCARERQSRVPIEKRREYRRRYEDRQRASKSQS